MKSLIPSAMKALYKTLALFGLIITLSLAQSFAQPLPYKSAHCQDFFMSIQKGEVQQVLECLERNPDLIYKTNLKGYTPLMVACAYGKTEIIAILIKNKANVNKGNYNNIFPLHLATLSGNEKAVKLLLKNKADLRVLTNDNQSIIDYAAIGGNKKLIDYYGRKDKHLLQNENLLLAAAQGGNLQLFDQLKRKGYNINHSDNDQNGVLHYAAKGGDANMCKYLVDYYNFNIRAHNNKEQYPMECALEVGNLEVVKFFFSVGIATNEKNSKGQHWIDLSIAYGWIHITNYLEKQNEAISELNARNETRL